MYNKNSKFSLQLAFIVGIGERESNREMAIDTWTSYLLEHDTKPRNG